MAQLEWVKSKASTWLELQTFNLDSVGADYGFYIIWHGGNPSRVVYVGQGNIKARIGSHRSNKDILAYARAGTLFVTWACVAASQVDGIERYLADQWNPLVGDAHPNAYSIAVNSPW